MKILICLGFFLLSIVNVLAISIPGESRHRKLRAGNSKHGRSGNGVSNPNTGHPDYYPSGDVVSQPPPGSGYVVSHPVPGYTDHRSGHGVSNPNTGYPDGRRKHGISRHGESNPFQNYPDYRHVYTSEHPLDELFPGYGDHYNVPRFANIDPNTGDIISNGGNSRGGKSRGGKSRGGKSRGGKSDPYVRFANSKGMLYGNMYGDMYTTDGPPKNIFTLGKPNNLNDELFQHRNGTIIDRDMLEAMIQNRISTDDDSDIQTEEHKEADEGTDIDEVGKRMGSHAFENPNHISNVAWFFLHIEKEHYLYYYHVWTTDERLTREFPFAVPLPDLIRLIADQVKQVVDRGEVEKINIEVETFYSEADMNTAVLSFPGVHDVEVRSGILNYGDHPYDGGILDNPPVFVFSNEKFFGKTSAHFDGWHESEIPDAPTIYVFFSHTH